MYLFKYLFVLLLHYLTSSVVLSLSSRSRSFYHPRNNVLMPPPTISGNFDNSNNDGIRQLDKAQVIQFIDKSRKRLGVASGNKQIEVLEMLLRLEKIESIMPSSSSHENSGVTTNKMRQEYICYGEYVNGMVESIVGLRLRKAILPMEFDIYVLLTYPNPMVDHRISTLIDFITELCKDNAILPNYKPLYRYELLHDTVSRIALQINDDGDTAATIVESNSYSSGTKRFNYIFDTIPQLSIGTFWYKVRRSLDNSYIYIRQRSTNRLREFEVQYQAPCTGVTSGTGTVSGFLTLEPATASKIVPGVSQEYFDMLVHEFETKVK